MKQEAKQEEKRAPKRVQKFGIKMQKKLVVLYVVILLAFVGLSIKLILITSENELQYSKQILSQQRYDSTTLPFKRGEIVDANGIILAVSEKVYNLVIDSNVIGAKEAYFEPTMQALEQYFPQLDMAAVREYVRTHKNSYYYVPVKQLAYEEIADFKEASAKDVNIRGIWFEEEYKRMYPNGSLACDVIGFTNGYNVGSYGLEEFYNETLNGTTGREFGYVSDDSTFERTIKPAVDGHTLHSTIDANIQSIVEKYLLQFHEEHKDNYRDGNGANNLGCIIMEVDTGNILAMASYPNYDLNNPRDPENLLGNVMVDETGKSTGEYISEEDLESMDGNLLYQNLNNLWKNFCITDTFEPGSTTKPFTVAMGLETGKLSGREVYECTGSLVRGDHTIACHNTYGDGRVSVADAIAWSCNVAMMKMGDAIGKTTFLKFQETFNFGLKTNIDLAGEARTANLVYNATNMNEAELATSTFGQGFNSTMIQVISGFCSLINGGYYYEPHMVSKVTNASGAVVANVEPRVLKQTISESTSEQIRKYCVDVVMRENDSRITGRTARPAGYAIGGKTGTAETYPRGNNEFVVSFIGFAPADDPQIAIYTVVDRPNEKKQDTARYATGIVRNVLTEVLPYLNIFMTEELSEAEILELQERQLEITNKYKTEEDTILPQENETQDTGSSSPNNNELPVWMSFPIDPETGNLVDPDTGNQLDPNTGDLVYVNQSIIN